MNIHLETERLLINPLSENDFHFILKLLNTPGWLQFIGDRNVKSADDAQKYIGRIMENPKCHYHTFQLKETKETIGIITFLLRDTQQFPDIGYAMLPEFENRGFASEAAKSFLNKVISDKTADKIIAITLTENKKSIRLLQKIGLRFEKEYMEGGQEFSLYSIMS